MLGLNDQRDDVRATLPNLMAILNFADPSVAPVRTKEVTKATGQHLEPGTGDSRATLASVSNSSVDVNVPVPLRIPVHGTHSLSDGALNETDIRYFHILLFLSLRI